MPKERPSVLVLDCERSRVPSLAEWALGWMAGLYLKRKELVLPKRIDPPFHTRASTLSGIRVLTPGSTTNGAWPKYSSHIHSSVC